MFLKNILASIFVLMFILFSCSPQEDDGFRFFAIGDMPYHVPEDFERLDRVIASLNRENPVFTVHVGDIKSGSSPCDDSYFNTLHDYFLKFQHPLFYTPGDNEWTDCHRPAAGAYDPVERLNKIREVFYANDETLQQSGLHVVSQSSVPQYEKFVENLQWEHQGITFGTLHVVGSNNNFKTDSAANNQEHQERDEANSYWLGELFSRAKTSQSDGIVFFLHAALNYNDSDTNGFSHFVHRLKEEIRGYDSPMLMVYGDHHRFLVEKPLADEKGRVLTNFTSLMVFGDQDMHAVEITVNKNYESLFEIRQHFVEGN